MAGPRGGPFHSASHHPHSSQIQTAKTQELNTLREENAGLTADLQQRQTEYEDLMGQKDDLNSQLQVTSMALAWLLPVPSCRLRGAQVIVESGGSGFQSGLLTY